MTLKLLSSIRCFFLFAVLFIVSQKTLAQKPTISSFSPTSAGPNAFVIITGANFINVSDVSFGGIPSASYFPTSSTNIIAYVGSGSSGAVTVTTPQGIASLDGFTFIPPPSISSFMPTDGYNGSVVTIQGRNLTGAYRITFGGIPAESFNVLSDSVATAVIGKGASGNISITTNSGTQELEGFNFIGPTINSFTPTAGTQGIQITITGMNFSGTTAVSFGGTPAKSFSVISSTTIIAVLGAGSPGDVSVTTAFGTATLAGFIKPFISSFTPSSAKPDDTVRIVGRNLSGTTTVSFGGIAATSFSVLSDTVITAIVAKGASGIISIATNEGIATIAGFYYVAPQPVINSFFPVSCASGVNVTLVGKHLSDAQYVYFGSNSAKSFTVTSDTSIIATVQDGRSGNVSVTTKGGYASLSGFTYTGPQIGFYNPNSGREGDTITINGNNLQNVSSVLFGDKPAAYFKVESSTIKAVIGKGSSGNITVLSDSGTSHVGGFIFIPPPPSIASFSPESGPVGTIVTITGSRFDSSITSNIVYLGAVRATVLSADSNRLRVVIPAGATYKSFSITSSTGLSAYSTKPFATTFASGDKNFISTSFMPKMEYVANTNHGGFGAFEANIHDMNGDGKPEIILGTTLFNGFTIFKNLSTVNNVSFDQGGNYGVAYNSVSTVIQDLDGDGKSDIAFTGGGGGTSIIYIYRNTSVDDSISLSWSFPYSHHGYDPGGKLEIGDLDGDGLPDLIEAHGNGSSGISVYRNTSKIGNISFSTGVDYITGSCPYGVAIGDVNQDGKPDIVVSQDCFTQITVFINECTVGKISFSKKLDIPLSEGNYSVKVADIDNDKKQDIIVSNSYSNIISVFRNTSENGNPSFNSAINISTGNTPYDFAIDDLNGDGKVDIAVANNYDYNILMLKNTSSPGNIVLQPQAKYKTGEQPRNVNIGDLNGDGKPDMITANWISYSSSVLMNNMAKVLPITMLNFFGKATKEGNQLQWQTVSEVNSAFFKVQRSIDGENFSSIGMLSAKGNSSVLQSYNYTDPLSELNINTTTYYYRLEMVDKDGDKSYSKIIEIEGIKGALTPNFSLYPNPVQSDLKLLFNGISGNVKVVIMNSIGKIMEIKYVNIQNGQTTINTQGLTPGNYFIEVHDNRGQHFTQKFIKMNGQ